MLGVCCIAASWALRPLMAFSYDGGCSGENSRISSGLSTEYNLAAVCCCDWGVDWADGTRGRFVFFGRTETAWFG